MAAKLKPVFGLRGKYGCKAETCVWAPGEAWLQSCGHLKRVIFTPALYPRLNELLNFHIEASERSLGSGGSMAAKLKPVFGLRGKNGCKAADFSSWPLYYMEIRLPKHDPYIFNSQ